MNDVRKASPISEEVARLMCPEAFRLRDTFEQAMQRLADATGADDEDLDRLKHGIMELARTTPMSTSQAAAFVAARHSVPRTQTG